jgi:hypothetical protein
MTILLIVVAAVGWLAFAIAFWAASRMNREAHDGYSLAQFYARENTTLENELNQTRWDLDKAKRETVCGGDQNVETLIWGAIIAHAAAEESEGWLVETLGLDRMTLRRLQHDAHDAASAIMQTRPSLPQPLPENQTALRATLDAHSKWRSPLREVVSTTAQRMLSKITAIKGQSLTSLGAATQNAFGVHETKSSESDSIAERGKNT